MAPCVQYGLRVWKSSSRKFTLFYDFYYYYFLTPKQKQAYPYSNEESDLQSKQLVTSRAHSELSLCLTVHLSDFLPTDGTANYLLFASYLIHYLLSVFPKVENELPDCGMKG